MERRHWFSACCAGWLALCPACSSSNDPHPNLSKAGPAAVPKVEPIPKDNPKLGSIADITPVYERPARGASRLGYLHAGGQVARAKEPYPGEGCDAEWYPIRPKGFVCIGPAASLDTKHPTLAAMALPPALNQALPYTYARTTQDTPIFEQDKQQKDHVVKQVGKLRKGAGLAVVGSWHAKDESGEQQRLGLMTNGMFVRAADLKAATPSSFQGAVIDKANELPVGFVVKRGVNFFKMEQGRPQKAGDLDYHQKIELTGRFRTIDDLRYWATKDDRWVRHRDVTVIRSLHEFPDFAKGQKKWIDVSIVTGTLVAYEGTKPVFATLVSVGRDRLGDPKTSASTERGTFQVVEKHVTDRGLDPKVSSPNEEIYDVPWSLVLGSGTRLHAAFWHDRFGIEHSSGALEVSPADGAWIFGWATPALPDDWHSVRSSGEDDTTVRIRK